MNRFFKTFFLIALLLTGAPSIAKADVDDGSVIDASVVAPLMAWVEAQTGVRVPVLPEVIASRSQFKAVLSRMGGRFAGRPRSVYVGGRVLMDNEAWDPEDSTELSLLVHELVHYAQSYMNVAWACPDAREAMAYTLQNKWLDQNGHNGFVNASWINRMSTCGGRNTTLALAQSND